MADCLADSKEENWVVEKDVRKVVSKVEHLAEWKVGKMAASKGFV